MPQMFYDDLSWKPQINKSEKPIYTAIAGKLEDDIKNSVLKPGISFRLRENWLTFFMSI